MFTCWWCHFKFTPLNSISNVVWTDVLIRKWNLLSEESADVLVVRQLQWVQDQDARPAVDQEETLCFRQRQDDLTEQVYLEVTHLFTTVSLWQPCWRHSCRDKHRHLKIVSHRKQAQNSCWVLRGLAAHVPVAAVISGKVFLQLALIHLRHKKKTPWNLCTSIQNQQKGNHSKGKWTSDFLSFKVPLQTKIKTDKISQLEHQMLELRVFRGADIYVWNI